jgi:hypothetical protein
MARIAQDCKRLVGTGGSLPIVGRIAAGAGTGVKPRISSAFFRAGMRLESGWKAAIRFRAFCRIG